jgi:cytochrome b561
MNARSGDSAAGPIVYSHTQIGLHWVVAALVLGQYATSGAITRTHQVRMIGQKISASDLTLHILRNRLGLLIVALMGLRLLVRWRQGAPAPLSDQRSWEARLASAAHWGFYALLIEQGVTGAVATYFWWPISAAHVVLFKVFLALLVVHVAAALWRTFVKRDGTLARMIRV